MRPEPLEGILGATRELEGCHPALPRLGRLGGPQMGDLRRKLAQPPQPNDASDPPPLPWFSKDSSCVHRTKPANRPGANAYPDIRAVVGVHTHWYA